MKLIYVAGPYSADSYSGIDDNIKKAEAVSIQLFRKGWAVITPHKNTAHYEIYEDDTLSYDTWIGCDMELLSRCDAIIFINGWQGSRGCRKEHEFAELMKISIFFSTNGIPSPNDIKCKKIINSA